MSENSREVQGEVAASEIANVEEKTEDFKCALCVVCMSEMNRLTG